MRSESFSVEAPPRLRVDLRSGRLHFETADAPEVLVEVEGPREDEAVIEQRGDEIVVELERRRILGPGGDHRIRVRAPHGASVEASVASADVEGIGHFGSVKVSSASGDVAFEESARIDVKTASGDIELRRVGGPARVRAASGDVEVQELEGDLQALTASGDVRLGSVSRGNLTLQSASGDVEVGIARGSTVWMDVSSMSGDTSCELDPRDEPPADDRPLVEVKARTMSGDVVIKRA